MKYKIIRGYKDYTFYTKKYETLEQAFSACALYITNPDIHFLIVVDTSTNNLIVNFSEE